MACRPDSPRLAVAVLAAALTALAPAVAEAQRNRSAAQCWTDDRGQRVCGDVVPPADARRERALIDRRGVVTRVLPAERTAEEIEAEARRAREREQRMAYDRYLLQAYGAVADIERARDERLGALDGQRRLTDKALTDTRATLTDLRERRDRPQTERASAAARSALATRIAEFERAEADHVGALVRLQDERTRIEQEFARDIDRFRSLRGPDADDR